MLQLMLALLVLHVEVHGRAHLSTSTLPPVLTPSLPPDNQYFMIMVGYDGIASSPLIFHHQSALLNLLESMDSGLLPQGCLEPPVWFLKNQVGGEQVCVHVWCVCMCGVWCVCACVVCGMCSV